MRTSGLDILVIVFCSTVLFLPRAFAQTTEVDTDRPGMDYTNFDLPSPDPGLCENACKEDPNCKAWTYVKPGIQGPQARCWLKSGIPEPAKNSCCVSGVIQPVQPQPDIRLARRALRVSAGAEPKTVTLGQKTVITVKVQDENGQPVPNATATISAGGGKFLGPDESYDPRGNLQGPYTATGLTDTDGVYTTSWVCNPCARAYGLRVEGAKDRYMTGTADLTIEIQTAKMK